MPNQRLVLKMKRGKPLLWEGWLKDSQVERSDCCHIISLEMNINAFSLEKLVVIRDKLHSWNPRATGIKGDVPGWQAHFHRWGLLAYLSYNSQPEGLMSVSCQYERRGGEGMVMVQCVCKHCYASSVRSANHEYVSSKSLSCFTNKIK